MQPEQLSLEVMGAEGIILKADEITSINVRMENGTLLGIRPGHTPLIGPAKSGRISYTIDGQLHHTQIEAGILTIRKNLVRILTTGTKPGKP